MQRSEFGSAKEEREREGHDLPSRPIKKSLRRSSGIANCSSKRATREKAEIRGGEANVAKRNESCNYSTKVFQVFALY